MDGTLSAGRVTDARWMRAQGSELDYWRRLDVGELLRICAEKPAFLRLLPAPLLAALFDGKEVLEIGCGPLGLSLAAFHGGASRLRRLVKIEPLPRIRPAETALADAAWARPLVDWVESLAAQGEYRQQPGEAVDEDAAFDTVVCYNVLDHVRDPADILARARRALRPGGRILVGVDCLSVVGRLRFEHLTRRRYRGSVLVEAHPHSFLPGHVRALLAAAGFADIGVYGLAGRLRRFAGSAIRPAFLGTRPPAP